VATRSLPPSGALAMMVALACCRSEPLPTPRDAAAENDPDDARAALLLRLHAQALVASPDTRRTCIVLDDATEASARLLRSLSGRGLGIIRPSRCVTREGRIVDALSGENAVRLTIRSFAFHGSGTADGFGVYALGGLLCGGGTYHLDFRLRKWEVADPVAPIVC
jgi:hypothetical protein